MRRPASLPLSRAGDTSVAKSCARLSSSRYWFCWSRRLLLSVLSASTRSLRLSATGPLSAAVPTTRPIARARKTAVSDTTWYRKLITPQGPLRRSEEVSQLEDEIVPPLGHHGEVGLADRGHGDRRRHGGDRG